MEDAQQETSEEKSFDDLIGNIEKSIFGILLFAGRYLRTAFSYIFDSSMFRNLAAGVGLNRYAPPATYLSVSIILWFFLASIALEGHVPISTSIDVLLRTVRSFDAKQLIFLASCLALFVALFAHSLRIAARVFRVEVGFREIFGLCAYGFGTVGLLGLGLVDATLSVVPALQENGHYQAARSSAFVIETIYLIGMLWLFGRYLLSVKIGLYLTWVKSGACNLLAFLIFGAFLLVLFPLLVLIFQQLVPSREIADFQKLATSAKTIAATAYGQSFDVTAINDIASRHAGLVEACVRATQSRDDRDLDLVIILKKNGDVADIRMWPETEIGRCIRNTLLVEQLPKPPYDNYPWYVPIAFLAPILRHPPLGSATVDLTKPLSGLKVRIIFHPAKREAAAAIVDRIAAMGGTSELVPRTDPDVPVYFATLLVNDEAQISAARTLRDRITDIEAIRLTGYSPDVRRSGMFSKVMTLWLDDAQAK